MKRAVAHIPSSAILMIVGAVACFSVSDAIIKWLAAKYPIPLLVWARWAAQVQVSVCRRSPSCNACREKWPRPFTESRRSRSRSRW